MRRLYVRIYLALLASLLVFAMLAGLTVAFVRLVNEAPASPWPDTGADIAERLLPLDRNPALLSSELAFWSERTGFSLALLSPDGAVIAKAGELPGDAWRETPKHPPAGRLWHAPGGIFGLTFKDGRHLVAVASNKGFHPVRSLHFAAVFFGIALAIAIGFYPLIRHLMRRLEELETGVALFGAGNLSARVQVKGHDEIAKLAATFNASADRLETLMNAHKLLLAHASHELRSPLSRLKMAIDRLQRNPGDQGAGAEAARNIGELDALVEEILLASRLQASGGSTLAIEPVDIAGLLAEECAAYQAEVTVADSSAPLVQGDTRLLRRLFRNLLENASAYGGGEAPEVTLSSTEAEILVFVCDRGAGVPEGEREKIFEPFYQLPRRMKGGGTGLGLALVRQIAAQHGGQVRYLARDRGGACFEVRLARSMS